MQVLILSSLSKEAVDQFDTYHLKTTIFDEKRDHLSEIIDRFDALVIDRSIELDYALLEQASSLKVIATVSKDTSNLDLDTLTALGITVINTSRSIANAIAEYTLFQIFNLSRFYAQEPFELKGKTLGIIGLGNVGAQVAKKAKALGMHIICYDPYLNGNRATVYQVEPTTLIDLLIKSDVVTIHSPLSEKTADLFTSDYLSLMKKGAVLINNAHPAITPTEDLEKALKEGILQALAMDLPRDWHGHDSLVELKNTFISRGRASLTAESSIGIGKELAKELDQFDRFATSNNAINMPIVPEHLKQQYRPNLDLAAFAGNFMGQYITGTVEEIAIYDHENLPDPAPLIQTFLEAFLSAQGIDGVNYVNALTFAYRRNISVHSKKTPLGEKGLSITITTTMAEHTLAVHLDGEGKWQITTIDGSVFAAIPSEHVLLIWHKPQPGVVGLIGSALGACGINISGMMLNEAHSDTAKPIIFINIDRAVDQDFLKGISKYENVFAAKYINTNLISM